MHEEGTWRYGGGAHVAYHQVNQLFYKLHSDFRILTQLQLVGIGVDFVFPLDEEEEGRKKNNPHLGSSRGGDSTYLKFLGVSGRCLEIVWRVSGRCLKGV